MSAVVFTLALFVVWAVIGLAGLVVVRTDVTDLRIALTAPIFGTALTVVPLFVLNNAGVSMEAGAPWVFAGLLVTSVLVLAVRRPRVPLAALPVVALAVVDLVLLGRPMFEFGFDWIASASGDMAYYVLSATHLMDHGLQSPVNVEALADNRDFPSSAQDLNLRGLRPGTQIALAGLAATAGRPPVVLYMSMSLAITMAGVCATGALAMQAARRWWAASVAAALLVVSPMAAYGVMLQLLPQDWGLGLAAALFAWIMRTELYVAPRPPLPDVLVISVLAVALFVVAYEVAAALILAYGVYIFLLVRRRRLEVRALGVVLVVALVATIVVVNTFLPRALNYLTTFVLRFGTSEGLEVSLFGYAIVPTALPGVAGLRSLFARPDSPHMGLFVAAAAVLLVLLFVASLITGWKGSAAGLVVLTNFGLAALLVKNGNDFGLFKLYMYTQPFVAATVAVFLSGLRSRPALGIALALLAIVAVVQVQTLNGYVDDSRDPIDLPHASDRDLLPKFRRLVATARAPVVTVTDNFALLRLQGASAEGKQLFFISRSDGLFGNSRPDGKRRPEDSFWKRRTLRVPGEAGSRKLTFRENPAASRVLSRRSCVVSLPSGSQYALNRRTLPEGSPDLVALRCAQTRNLLAFIVSSLGQPATLPENRGAVSFWQLEDDPWFPGRTFSGFGRYALFQILGPTPKVRVGLEFTTSPTRRSDGSYRLPPAAVVGTERARFAVTGSGSARVFSPPLRPRIVNGRPYIVFDMGRRGELPVVPRPGVTALWGKSVLLDPRRLTSYVRDVSVVSDADYRQLRAPRRVERFPADLGHTGLEYSGIYEDGWVGARSYAMLAGGRRGTLVVRAEVLPQAPGQRLEVLVDGRTVYSARVAAGALSVRAPVPTTQARRRVELIWSREVRLSAQDARRASALLRYVGVAPTPNAKSSKRP